MPQQFQPKYVFIAEGIGITPFRSMIRYLLDKKRQKQIVLFYRTTRPEGFIFRELLGEAERVLGFQSVYILSKNKKGWTGETGYIDEVMLKKYVNYPQTPVYYLSGPQQVVESYRTMLGGIGVPNEQMKTDLFTGYEEIDSK